MTDLVPTIEIEDIVGARRHPTKHIARANSTEQVIYILHSQECLLRGKSLLKCEYTLALSEGITFANWEGYYNAPVVVTIAGGRLFPLGFSPYR